MFPILLIAFLSAACGASGASMRTKTLRMDLVAINTARDSVLSISKEREKQIYDSCNPPSCTKEEGHAKVDAWEKEVDAVIKSLDIGYNAIHDAFVLDDSKSAIDAAAAAKKALALYQQLKETP